MATIGPDGVLVVDKPVGWTSHDVVARTRRLAGTRRVGHAGTLDPMATGVLVLGIGRATRLLTHLVGAVKSYEATIRLGQTTVSDDADGEVTTSTDAGGVTDEEVDAALAALVGEVEQVPSSVSAIKVEGRRAYARVRAGEDVALSARRVTITRLTRLATRRAGALVDVDVRVDCSSGTYVRAIARDAGAALGVGGHLVALRRTAVGPFTVDAARTLDQLESAFTLQTLADAARLAFPVRDLDDREATELSHGRRLAWVPAAQPDDDRPVAAIGPDGVLVALLGRRGPDAAPLLVLTPAGAPATGVGPGNGRAPGS